MKRFFFVFSILMIVFLVLMAGCLVVDEYASIKTYNSQPVYFQGWGVTLIPYHGSRIVYQNGDVFFIRQVSLQELKPDDVILFYVKDRKGIMSGLVAAVGEGQLIVDGADGNKADVPAGEIVGKYISRIAWLGSMMGMMRSPVAIAVFGAALVASILLWRLLPSRKPMLDGLSPSDSEIASILY